MHVLIIWIFLCKRLAWSDECRCKVVAEICVWNFGEWKRKWSGGREAGIVPCLEWEMRMRMRKGWHPKPSCFLTPPRPPFFSLHSSLSYDQYSTSSISSNSIHYYFLSYLLFSFHDSMENNICFSFQLRSLPSTYD